MSKEFYTLEAALDYTQYRDDATVKDRVAALAERDRRSKAVRDYLKARGHVYMKRVNAFATRKEAEAAILQMGFPYKINICKAEWL